MSRLLCHKPLKNRESAAVADAISDERLSGGLEPKLLVS